MCQGTERPFSGHELGKYLTCASVLSWKPDLGGGGFADFFFYEHFVLSCVELNYDEMCCVTIAAHCFLRGWEDIEKQKCNTTHHNATMKEKNQSELKQRDEGFITSYTKHFKIQTAIFQEVPKRDRPLVAQTRCHKFISGFSLIHAVDFFGLQRMNLSSFGVPVAPPSGQHFDFSTTNIKIYQADYCKIDCRYSWSPENQLILVILSFFGLFFLILLLKV